MPVKSKEQVRTEFLDHLRGLVRYWCSLGKPTEETCDGVVFSLLVALDGCSDLPAFNLSPSPHPEDRAFLESEGEDWYPDDGKPINDDCQLHELWATGKR